LNVALKIVRYFKLYFLEGLVLDFFVGFCIGFDAGFGVDAITGCAVPELHWLWVKGFPSPEG